LGKKNRKKIRLCKTVRNKRHAIRKGKKISNARKIRLILEEKACRSLEDLQHKKMEFGRFGRIVEVISRVYSSPKHKIDISIKVVFQYDRIVFVYVKNQKDIEIQSKLRGGSRCLMVISERMGQRDVTQIALNALDECLSIKR